jgi:hypothetical protein
VSGVRGRLLAFLFILLGVFGTAYAIGEKLPGHSHAGHNHSHNAVLVTPGFQSGNYVLVTDSVKGGGGEPRVLTFHLEMTDGMRVTQFELAHEAYLHTVLIRPDLSGFQHIHPDIAADGSWQVTLEEPGQWHLVFDSVPKGETLPVVVSANSDDEVSVEPQPLPPPNDNPRQDGLRVLRSGLDFTVVNDDGSAAVLEPYLGQAAHLVAIRQGDLAYVHLHAMVDTSMPGMFMFGNALPQPGTYRAFLQFGHDGKVVTIPFTITQP